VLNSRSAQGSAVRELPRIAVAECAIGHAAGTGSWRASNSRQRLEARHGASRIVAVNSSLKLRPVAEDDLPLVARLYSDPEATGDHEWFGWEETHWIRGGWDDHQLLAADSGVLIVEVDGLPAGVVTWRERPAGNGSSCWSTGIALLPDARGQGHGTVAQRMLVRYLFAYTRVNRVEAEAELTNIAELRALEKAGYTREGIARGVVFRAGRWRDRAVYSVLRAEVALDEPT
jgi:RimJ/RimL family protein N-acetyltransferase